MNNTQITFLILLIFIACLAPIFIEYIKDSNNDYKSVTLSSIDISESDNYILFEVLEEKNNIDYYYVKYKDDTFRLENKNNNIMQIEKDNVDKYELYSVNNDGEEYVLVSKS